MEDRAADVQRSPIGDCNPREPKSDLQTELDGKTHSLD